MKKLLGIFLVLMVVAGLILCAPINGYEVEGAGYGYGYGYSYSD